MQHLFGRGEEQLFRQNPLRKVRTLSDHRLSYRKPRIDHEILVRNAIMHNSTLHRSEARGQRIRQVFCPSDTPLCVQVHLLFDRRSLHFFHNHTLQSSAFHRNLQLNLYRNKSQYRDRTVHNTSPSSYCALDYFSNRKSVFQNRTTNIWRLLRSIRTPIPNHCRRVSFRP